MEMLMRERTDALDAALDEAVPLREPLLIYEAMRYSLFPPPPHPPPPRSKGFLCICATELFHGSPAAAMPTACALEMLHAASLIHNDLPCMDDDDLRENHPTNHKVFGEDMAILAGDALYALAVEHVAARTQGVCGARVLQVIAEMSRAVGSEGMAGGQFLDLACPRTIGLEMEAVQACDAILGTSMESMRSAGGMVASDANLDPLTHGRVGPWMHNSGQARSQCQYTDVEASSANPHMSITPVHSQGCYTGEASPAHSNATSTPVQSQDCTDVEASPAHSNMSITSVEDLQSTHLFKATSLAECAAVCGAILGEAEDNDIENVRRFGRAFGLLSYLVDDFLKVKTPHPGRVSHFKFLGLKKAKEVAEELRCSARHSLRSFDQNKASPLLFFVDKIANQIHSL